MSESRVMKLRILQVVTLSEKGGAQRHVIELSRELLQRGHEVHLACGADGPLIDEAQVAGVRVHVQRSLRRSISPAHDLAELWTLVSLIRTLDPHIVHSHSTKAGLLARLAARFCGVPALYTAHGLVFLEPLGRSRRWVYLNLERMGGRCAERIIAVSEADGAAARQYRLAPPERVIVVPNGIASSPQVSYPPPPERPFRFGVIANAYPNKGLDVLLDALRQPLIQGLSIEVLIAGDGPEKPRLERAALDLPVRFLGRVDDVPTFLRTLHATIQPSLKEGWPYSVLEAMAAGRPVIAADVGGMRDQLGGEACGWLVPPGDPVALAEAIACALSDPQEAARRGREGSRRVASHFTVARMVDAIERQYLQIVSEF